MKGTLFTCIIHSYSASTGPNCIDSCHLLLSIPSGLAKKPLKKPSRGVSMLGISHVLPTFGNIFRPKFRVYYDAGWGSEMNTRFCGRIEFSHISSGKMLPEKSARNIKNLLDMF